MAGTVATIWVAVGVPTITATVAPKRTDTGPKLKLLPNRVTLVVVAGPLVGLNWCGEAAKSGGGGRTRKSSSLVTEPPPVWTVIFTGPGEADGTVTVICEGVGVPTIVATVMP